MDRRESARHTGPGEYLSSIADPVFDARRAVDYLLTRNDVAVLASRLLEEDSLFGSGAWLPTLYSEDVLADLGLTDLLGDWDALSAAITPEISRRALYTYRSRRTDCAARRSCARRCGAAHLLRIGSNASDSLPGELHAR